MHSLPVFFHLVKPTKHEPTLTADTDGLTVSCNPILLWKPEVRSGICWWRHPLPSAGMHMPWVTYLRLSWACTQRLAARGDGYPLAAATVAAIARSPVHIERPSTGRTCCVFCGLCQSASAINPDRSSGVAAGVNKGWLRLDWNVVNVRNVDLHLWLSGSCNVSRILFTA